TSSQGGGIYVFASDLHLANCTVSSNSAFDGGGLYQTARGTEIRDCTVTGNTASGRGGGVFSRYDFALENSVVSDNAGPATSPDIWTKSSVHAQNSDIGSAVGVVYIYRAGNVIFGSAQLGPLADNGGPTLTHMPLSGSRVRNTGSLTTELVTDQRGQ